MCVELIVLLKISLVCKLQKKRQSQLSFLLFKKAIYYNEMTPSTLLATSIYL